MAETREVLEPIVNTEPKELQVPEFNKKEIEEIVVDNILKLLPAGFKQTIIDYGNIVQDGSDELYKITFTKPLATELPKYDALIFTLSNSFVFLGVPTSLQYGIHGCGSFLASSGDYKITRFQIDATSNKVIFGNEYEPYSNLVGYLIGVKF